MKHYSLSVVRLSLYLMLAGLFPVRGASAAALYLPDLGARSSGRAGAVTARGLDGSTIFHNPAGMFDLEGTHLTAFTGMIFNPAEFTRQDRDFTTGEPIEGGEYPSVSRRNAPGWIPGLFAVTDAGTERFRLGLGIHGPYGTPSTVFPETGPQRYQVVRSNVGQIFYEFGAGYQPFSDLDLAADFVLSDVFVGQTLMIHTDFFGSETNPTTDIKAKFDLEDEFRPGFLLGGRYRFGDFTIGLSWLKSIWFKLKGSVRATLPDPEGIADPDVQTLVEGLINGVGREDVHPAQIQVTLPDVVKTGLHWQINRRFDLELDWVWINWSLIPRYPVIIRAKGEPTPEDPEGNDVYFFGLRLDSARVRDGAILVRKNWQDTNNFRLGGDYVIDANLTARGGFQWEQSAMPDSTLEPSNMDLDKYGPAVGLSWTPEFLRGEDSSLSIDMAFNWLFARARSITDSRAYLNIFNETEPSVTTNGKYTTNYQIYSMGLTGHF